MLIFFAVVSVSAMGRDPKTDFSFRAFEDDHGGFYVVWADSAALRARHLLNNQDLWETSGTVVTSRLASARDWNGLSDGQGGLTLFWNEGDGIHAQRLNADKSRRFPGDSVRMSSNTALLPQAVPDAAGGTLVVWTQALETGRAVVVAQRFKNGQPMWGPQGVRVSRRPSFQTNVRVVHDNLSGAIVAWRDELNQSSELRVQRLDGSGTRLWGEEGMPIFSPMGVSETPQMAALGGGDAVLSWVDYAAGIKKIVLERVGPGPIRQWNGTKDIVSAPLSSRWNPVLHADGEGGTWVAWSDFRNNQTWQVFVNHLHSEGHSVWPQGEVAIAPALGDQGMAAMTDDGLGGIWIVWVDNRGTSVSLYGQHVDSSGKRLEAETGLKITSGLKDPTKPYVVPLGQGRAAVVWAVRSKIGQWKFDWKTLGL